MIGSRLFNTVSTASPCACTITLIFRVGTGVGCRCREIINLVALFGALGDTVTADRSGVGIE